MPVVDGRINRVDAKGQPNDDKGPYLRLGNRFMEKKHGKNKEQARDDVLHKTYG